MSSPGKKAVQQPTCSKLIEMSSSLELNYFALFKYFILLLCENLNVYLSSSENNALVIRFLIKPMLNSTCHLWWFSETDHFDPFTAQIKQQLEQWTPVPLKCDSTVCACLVIANSFCGTIFPYARPGNVYCTSTAFYNLETYKLLECAPII